MASICIEGPITSKVKGVAHAFGMNHDDQSVAFCLSKCRVNRKDLQKKTPVSLDEIFISTKNLVPGIKGVQMRGMLGMLQKKKFDNGKKPKWELFVLYYSDVVNEKLYCFQLKKGSLHSLQNSQGPYPTFGMLWNLVTIAFHDIVGYSNNEPKLQYLNICFNSVFLNQSCYQHHLEYDDETPSAYPINAIDCKFQASSAGPDYFDIERLITCNELKIPKSWTKNFYKSLQSLQSPPSSDLKSLSTIFEKGHAHPVECPEKDVLECWTIDLEDKPVSTVYVEDSNHRTKEKRCFKIVVKGQFFEFDMEDSQGRPDTEKFQQIKQLYSELSRAPRTQAEFVQKLKSYGCKAIPKPHILDVKNSVEQNGYRVKVRMKRQTANALVLI